MGINDRNNKRFIYAVIVILILIVVYKYTNDYINNRNIVYMTDKTNNYKIRSSYDNSHDALYLISEVNDKIMVFFTYLKNKYKINNTYDDNNNYDSMYPMGCRDIVSRMLYNYNPEAIIENDPRKSNETSYTISKGKELHLCLRNKKYPNELHPVDDILFVVLHEASHMGNANWDLDAHKNNFWTIFKFVLYEAKNAGIYNPINYKEYPITYCGLYVNYNPYYDDLLENIWEVHK